ncbi:Cell cycle-associated protein [Forsythia ovata]|uniref:Cell cycle-associated protein n=1 Tax=Forsythia ovata TaxID=205694 RepID=A0ABD1T4L5_9LAMI
MALRCPFYLFRHIQTSIFTSKVPFGWFPSKTGVGVSKITFLASIKNPQNYLRSGPISCVIPPEPDIQARLKWAESSGKIKLFLRKIATDLLRLGPRCKGRYVTLASLTKRLGAKTLLDMNPNLLFETAKAYVDDDVCCAATTFLKCFLECLRDEYWSSNLKVVTQNTEVIACNHFCMDLFLDLNTYALPGGT